MNTKISKENVSMPISAMTESEILAQIGRYQYWSKQNSLPWNIINEMLNDPVIMLGISLLYMPILQSDYEIVSVSKEQSDWLTNRIRSAWESIAICLGYQPIIDGYVGGEVLYDIDDDGYYIVDVLSGTSTNTLLATTEDTREIYPVIDGKHIPVWKSVVNRIMATPSNPYGRSYLRCAYDAWHRKGMAELSRIRQIERIAGAQIWIEYPSGVSLNGDSAIDKNDEAFRTLSQNFSKFRVIGVRAPTNGLSQWKLQPIPQSDNSSSFKTAIDSYNSDILRAFMIPDRLVMNSGDAGSRADQLGKQDIYYLTITGLVANISKVVERRIFKPLLEAQYGNLAEKANIEFAPMIDSEKQMLVDILKNGYENGKIEIAADYIKGRCGIQDTIEGTI